MADYTHYTTTGSTTDSYADVSLPTDFKEFLQKSFIVQETGGTNGITYKVLASNDGTNFVEVKAATAVAAGGSSAYALNDYYSHLKVQVISTTALSPGNYRVQMAAKER